MNKNQNHMTFSTIALSKGYFFVDSVVTPATPDENLEFLKSLTDETPLLSEVLSIQAELMRYGYMFDIDCMRAMLFMTPSELNNIAKDIEKYLAEEFGDGHFVSLFGNFPNTVMEMSETEMFIHQICHYLSGGEYQPHIFNTLNEEEIELSRVEYSDCIHNEYKPICLATEETMLEIFQNMLNAQQSLTSYDKDVVKYFCQYAEGVLCDNILEILPETIPFKETLCIVAGNVKGYKLKNVTDVLRLAVYMSGGDITLPAIPKSVDYGWWPRGKKQVDMTPYNFKKFSRSERRLLLSKIEDVFAIHSGENYDALADMKKYVGKWIRLGEILHPFEYKKQFPKTARAFYMLRDCSKYIFTWNGRLELARQNYNLNEIVSVLAERPGEFARNIDWVLRNFNSIVENDIVIGKFSDVIDKVSTKLIYELIERYNHRNDEYFLTNRTVFIKGARKPTKIKNLTRIDSHTLNRLNTLLLASLYKRFTEMGSLKGQKFAIDASIENIMLPKNMRSMNIAPGQQSRGTRIPLKINTEIMRLYCRWMDPQGRYDLDLSVTAFDENYKKTFRISWDCDYKMKNQDRETIALFSGDVRHRVGNSAEYIDVHIERLKEYGVRYLVADVRDFDGQGFTCKDAWAGVMERTVWGTPGETTWAPDTISCGFRLTSACTNIIMTVVDLQEMVMYVVDEDIAGVPVASCTTSAQAEVCKRYTQLKPYFNARNLIEKNVEARGGEAIVMEHEEFENFIKLTADIRKNLTDMLQETLKLREVVDNLGDTSAIDQKIAMIKEKIELIDNTKTISYNDIAVDYTSLFKWMF